MDPLERRSLARISRQIQTDQSAGIADTVWPMPFAGDTMFFSQGENDGSRALISSALPLSSILGIYDHGELKKAQAVHLTDKPSKDYYDGRRDREIYGRGPLGGALTMSTAPLSGSVVEKQHSTTHTAYVGRVGDKAILDNYRPYPDGRRPHYGNYLGAPSIPFDQHFRGSCVSRVKLDGVTAAGFMTFIGDPSSDPSSEEANLDAFKHARAMSRSISEGNQYVRARGYWVSRYTYSVDNTVHRLIDGLDRWDIDIRYGYRLDYAPAIWPGRYWTLWEVHLKFSSQIHPTYGHSLASDWVTFPSDLWSIHDHSSVKLLDWNGDSGSFPEPSPSISVSFPAGDLIRTYSEIYQVGDASDYQFEKFRIGRGRSPHWRAFAVTNAVIDEMNNIRPSSFIAASKAFDDNTLALEANNLQNLQQLPGILNLLPDLGQLSRLVAKCFSGDPSAIKDLIDFVTEEVLKWRFERLPTQKDVDEVLSTDIDGVLSAVTSQRTAIIKGKFEYSFSESENFLSNGTLHLDTRAQIEVRFDLSTFLAGMLAARSLGLLPTLASIWNLLPFSFVVDWFTNMSKRLHLVDNATLFMTVGINYCLWSYKITWYPSEELLAEYNLVSLDPETPFGITVFVRELSAFMPRLRESRFDFLRPSSKPDPITVGSLLWQLFT